MGKSPPDWAMDITMIERGYTERELQEEFTLETLRRFQVYLGKKAQAEEAEMKVAEARARQGRR